LFSKPGALQAVDITVSRTECGSLPLQNFSRPFQQNESENLENALGENKLFGCLSAPFTHSFVHSNSLFPALIISLTISFSPPLSLSSLSPLPSLSPLSPLSLPYLSFFLSLSLSCTLSFLFSICHYFYFVLSLFLSLSLSMCVILSLVPSVIYYFSFLLLV
jgi:hypothetical protein